MTPAAFKQSLSRGQPPAGLWPALAALWWTKKGAWDKAHTIVMDEDDTDCAWVHAHLHRIEGDVANARYWYGQARKSPGSGSLDAEWEAILGALLKAGVNHK